MTYSEVKKDVPDCAYSHKLHLCFSLENTSLNGRWCLGVTSEEIEYSSYDALMD